MSSQVHLATLALTWALYGLIHSLLASHTVKAWFASRYPQAFPAYRLCFNLLSGLLLVPPLWLLFSYPGDLLWQYPGVLYWLVNIIALSALAGLALSAGFYDTGEFLGTRQLRQAATAVDDQAPMSLSWAHRFVRHPWYFFGLLILWTREMNAALLVSVLCLTLYVLLGSRQEEKKLLSIYGEQYREYRRRVPGLFPLPWKFINKQQAREILAMRKDLPEPADRE